MLIFKLAWRNIWRNRRRSGVIIFAVALGMFTVLCGLAYSDGIVRQMLETTIGLDGGHIQVARAGFHTNPALTSVMQADEVASALEKAEGLDYAPLVKTAGMVQSTEKAYGAAIYGVEPEAERRVTSIHQFVTDGAYLTGASGEILMGRELADRLNLRLGEKAVLLANDVHNDVSGGAYRIIGLFETNSRAFDRSTVFVALQDARELLGYQDVVSAFTIKLADVDALDETTAALKKVLPVGLEMLTWRQRNEALVLMMDAYDWGIVILVVILFAAVTFTIVNSFLMVIFERIREMGVMMANGVHPRKIRLMLYAEAGLMMLIGFAIGGAFSAGFVMYYGHYGIDLSNFSEGLRSLGIGSIVYPVANAKHFLLAIGTIVGMVFLSVLYPAFKASRFGVVEAINHV